MSLAERTELIARWMEIGFDNPWIAKAEDPPFTKESFAECQTVDELEKRVNECVWALGVAFYYQDLCFINQVDGGDEWLTIRHGIAFESINLQATSEKGGFTALIDRLMAATEQQCRDLTY